MAERGGKMGNRSGQPSKRSSNAAIKVTIFAAFIVGAIALIRFTPIKSYLTEEFLELSLKPAVFGHR